MTFAEKLDLLMNITNTTNSLLARQISLDASAISRLRRGIRTPSRNVTYLEPMAKYFALNCRDEYQKAAIWKAIKDSTPHFNSVENKTLDVIIYKWLSDNTETASNSLDEFMHDFINFQFKKMPPLKTINIEEIVSYPVSETTAFYGKEGKQNAVIAFLSLVLKNKKPQTLLLYSDEDIEWLTDSEFILKWATLMAQVIAKGNRIKIVHSITRDFDEMISGIKEWIPLYMTGSIEPYYYPKTQDGLFKHTFFIAPETAAVKSSSVRNKNKNTTNYLFTNRNMISSIAEEFNDFLSLCRPLMRIFTIHNRQEEYLTLLEEFEDEAGNAIIKTDTLSDITMPPTVAQKLLARINDADKEILISYNLKRAEKLRNNLINHSFTEILTLPKLELVLSGKVPVDFSDVLNDTPLFYTPEEYLEHLKNIIILLKTCENYHIIITEDKYLEGSTVYVKEDVGVLVGKPLPPSIIFAINENNMTAAFWDYMNVILNKKPINKNSRIQTINELERLRTSLELKLS